MSLLLLWNGSVQGTYNDTIPDLYLEWSPTTGPREAPAWERIPLSDIRSIDIGRGRNRELDQFQAGRMTVVLDNRDRTYDPQENSNVKPMRRIRLRAVWDTTYDLFSGFVDSWDQDYDMTQEARAVVTATDGFKVWERAATPSSVYAHEVLKDAPVSFWRLNESSFSDRVEDSAGNAPLTIEGVPTFGQASMVFGEPGTAVQLPGDLNNTISRVGPQLLTGPPITLEIIHKRTASGSDGAILGQWNANGGFYITSSSTGVVILVATNGAGTDATAITTGVNIDDLDEHHLVAIWDSAGDIKLYVDGVSATLVGTTNLTTTPTFADSQTILFVGGTPAGYVQAGDACTLQMAAVYDYALTEDQITAHVDAMVAPWNGDTTGERIENLADVIEWPDSEREIDTGESTVQSAELNGSALDNAQQARDVEYGELFFTAGGNLRFIGRHNKWQAPYNEPLFTLSDDGADLAYGAIKFNYDDQLIRNRVTIGYNNGLEFTANSTASQDQYFIQGYGLTGLIGDQDSEAVDYANYILGRYKDPLLRAQGITIHPQRDPDVYFPAVLAADLVYQINVERTPQGTGSAIDIDYTIEGVQHHIEPKLWRTELQLSPADTPGAFILDSTSQGVLDTNFLGW